jgi:hypothetical protein
MKSKKIVVKYDSNIINSTFELNINDLMNIGWLINKFLLKIVVLKDKFNSKVIQKVIDNFKK